MIHAAGLMLLCRGTDRLLFVKRGPGSDFAGHFCFPGGCTEPGETPEQTAEREAFEEAGANPHGNPEFWVHQVNDYETPVSYTTFLAHVEAEFVPTLNYENTAWAWAPANDPPLPLHPGCEAALRKLTGEAAPEERAAFAAEVAWNRERSAKLDAALDATKALMARADTAFNEADHPRAADGKFGSGGGSLHQKHEYIPAAMKNIGKSIKYEVGRGSTNAKTAVEALKKAGVEAKYSDDYTTTPAQMRHGGTEIQINSAAPFWRNPKKEMKAAFSSGRLSSDNALHLVAHEMAHIGSTFSPIDREISPEDAGIAKKVSKYATENKNEFIAEYVAGVVAGQEYEPEVKGLYQKYMGELHAESKLDAVVTAANGLMKRADSLLAPK